MSSLTIRDQDDNVVATVEVPEISLRTNALILNLHTEGARAPFAELRLASLGATLVVTLTGRDPQRKDLPGQASTRLTTKGARR